MSVSWQYCTIFNFWNSQKLKNFQISQKFSLYSSYFHLFCCCSQWPYGTGCMRYAYAVCSSYIYFVFNKDIENPVIHTSHSSSTSDIRYCFSVFPTYTCSQFDTIIFIWKCHSTWFVWNFLIIINLILFTCTCFVGFVLFNVHHWTSENDLKMLCHHLHHQPSYKTYIKNRNGVLFHFMKQIISWYHYLWV